MKKPKASPAGNTEKDPDDWVSRRRTDDRGPSLVAENPMRAGAQRRLRREPDEGAASKLIDEMREKAGVSDRDTRR
jgi:hypothetical protein